MATMNYKVCDRCGKRLPEPIFWLIKRPYKMRMLFNTPWRTFGKDFDYEFCTECAKEVRDFIMTPPVEALNKQDDGGEG